jgi:RNA polymerase sigma-70 factor (ECF subfamily)
MKQSRDGSHPKDETLSKKQFVMEAFDRYERQLTAYASRLIGGPTGNLHAAKDVVQFTFMKLCQQPHDELSGRLAPWLYTVCRNRIFDEFRASKNRQQLHESQTVQIDLNSPDPAKQMEIDDFLDRLPELLRTLSDGEREVIELWSQGLKPGEISTVIDKPAGSVRVALHRGIKKLQQHPEVSIWLERATGQGEREQGQLSGSRAAFNGSAFKATTTTGERK